MLYRVWVNFLNKKISEIFCKGTMSHPAGYCTACSVVNRVTVKGSLSPLKKENKLNEDLYCTRHKFVLIRFIQINQGHRDSLMHEVCSSVNKVNKAVAKVRTIGDRLPSRLLCGTARTIILPQGSSSS